MSAYDTPPKPCPCCGLPMDADWVDVGVGMVQCGPYHCFECNASEIGPERDEVQASGKLDADEERTGFYKGRISPHANQVGGVPIDHQTADTLYRAKYFAEHGNPYNAPVNRYAAAKRRAQP
jgi:hypothetical protein